MVCLISIAHGQSTNERGSDNPLGEADLRKALSNVCNQANEYYKAEHFPILAPQPDKCTFSTRLNLDYKETVGVFDPTQDDEVGAEILVRSGKVVAFHNYAAAHAFYGAKAPLYDKPPPATWTETHATEVALKFADIFVKPWGAKIGKPYVVHFSWNHTDLDPVTNTVKTGDGQWMVKWRRETATGIPFGTDGVQMNLSEKYGPYNVGIFFRVEYHGEDDHVEPIAKDKALIEARKGLDKILASKVAIGWVPGAKAEGEPDIALYIVCPNDLLNQKSMMEAAFSGEGKGRLAWVATYKVSNPSNPSVSDHVSVYIDAKDGSFLGGML